MLSSNKTNILVMTENRMAHPLLLSLANIDSDILSKESMHGHVLLVLLPIGSFAHKKTCVRTLLSDWLIHESLDFVWFTSVVSREDVLRRGRGDLHQQGDADRDTGYSWGTGAIEDKGDRCLDSSYSLGSVKVGIEVTGTEVAILHLEIGAARVQGGS